MKKSVLFLFFSALAFGTFAQDGQPADRATQLTAELTDLYQLDKDQQEKMLYIQQTRQENIASVADLAQSDPEAFIKKMNSIQRGMEISIQMMLDEGQLKVFYNEVIKRRQRQADLVRQMQDAGASPKEIELALATME